MLEFGPILAWYSFPAAEEFVVVFDVFFRAMMCQMFSIGERSGLQAGQFGTRTLLLRSHAVVIAAVCGFALSCWNTQDLPWNRRRLEGNICCSKTFIFLSAFIVPCKLPIPYALMNEWMNEWCIYIALYCVLLYTQSALQSCGGGGGGSLLNHPQCAASTWNAPTYASPYHQRCWLLNWTLITCWKISLLFSPEDTASMISNKNVKFGLVWP